MTLARTVFLESEFGALSELPRTGSALENAYVFDDAARELKEMASQGLLRVVEESTHRVADDELIRQLRFVRLR